MSRFPHLFQPLDLGPVQVPNRLMFAPVGTNYCTPAGEPTHRLRAFLAERARGGAGLLITEGAYVCPTGKETPRQMGMDRDELVPPARETVEAVRQYGAKIFVQLNHAGRQTNSAVTGSPPLAPSSRPCLVNQEEPVELDGTDMERLARAFGQAARRAREAGFDGIEVLGGHGHLLHQFLSPYTNAREDQYGGSLENRMRYPLQVLERVRSEVGRDYPVAWRLSTEDFVEGGLTFSDTLVIAERLVQAGVDLIHVSGGIYESGPMIVPPLVLPQACYAGQAGELRRALAGGAPVAVTGRIKRPELAEELLAQGQADMIGMGRALLADPELPEKSRTDRIRDIRPCVACNQGCMDRMLRREDITCLSNPGVGREHQDEQPATGAPKTLMVIGGGPAGMEAARTAAQRGHRVVLYEREPQLGGQLNLATALSEKAELNDLGNFLAWQLEALGVEVHTGHEAGVADVEEIEPDAIIMATGARPWFPSVPGLDLGHVMTAEECLSGRCPSGGRVLVVGGGLVGCETAALVAEKGNRVLLIEAMEQVGTDIGPFYRRLLLEKLLTLGVELYPQTALRGVFLDKVVVERADQPLELSGIDTVVIAAGYQPRRDLLAHLEQRYPLHVIGDSNEVRKALDAIHEGREAALRV